MHLTKSISLLARNQTDNKPVLENVTSLKETKNEQNGWKIMSGKKNCNSGSFSKIRNAELKEKH